MDFKVFVGLVILVFVDLFVMGVCSAIATNSINSYKDTLKNGGQGNSVTYSSYSYTQSTVNITVWITWVCVGLVLLALLGYLGYHFSQKAEPNKEVSDVINVDNLAEAFDAEGAQKKYEENQSLFVGLLILAGLALGTATVLSAASLLSYYYSNKIAQAEGLKGDSTQIQVNNGTYYVSAGGSSMVVATIAGLVVIGPIIIWALYTLYKDSKKHLCANGESEDEQNDEKHSKDVAVKPGQKKPVTSPSKDKKQPVVVPPGKGTNPEKMPKDIRPPPQQEFSQPNQGELQMRKLQSPPKSQNPAPPQPSQVQAPHPEAVDASKRPQTPPPPQQKSLHNVNMPPESEKSKSPSLHEEVKPDTGLKPAPPKADETKPKSRSAFT
jgi:hypothetical protein